MENQVDEGQDGESDSYVIDMPEEGDVVIVMLEESRSLVVKISRQS